MATESPVQHLVKSRRKRKFDRKNNGQAESIKNGYFGTRKKLKNNKTTRKLIQKRVREYNSDDDEEETEPFDGETTQKSPEKEEGSVGDSSEEERDEQQFDGDDSEEKEGSEDEESHEIQPGMVTKFPKGSNAFRMAFMKIMKRKVLDETLGPVLSGQKKLIAKKLAEEETELKVKGEAKKEKHLMREKGHVKPANFLDAKEKILISVATKGVVKLFNAVNKAQHAQKGLNASRSKDAKALGKQRKEAFIAELRKTSLPTTYNPSTFSSIKGVDSTQSGNNNEHGWAPLRDSYMLTNSKLKDWDKMPGPAAAAPVEMPLGSSSDEE